ncbi:fumarylacetoacetate hydrolase family protein [Glacieibacterium megasporae]|uniref:fumarylacetoacetate hydrolase family protein n=1 Tax=Glacieibacterium megasporae TaxID=2835787 RepID=UPI001C1E2276|nr:fumarylacetoacetate hydrolase family protein [Polymorphobacter megasporae]UAJ10522.1 fumarylacetoacetate hydrolase family protein [Polymorphobacter megasporae]
MRLVRFTADGTAHVGMVTGDMIVDVTDRLPQFATMSAVIAAGIDGLDLIASTCGVATPTIALGDTRLLAPVERPGKYLAIGMNYAKHLVEADKLGVARSKHQTWFNKQTTCIAGPYDEIDPGVTEKLDYECELGLVIGTVAKSVRADDALSHVFGYFVANDVSARDWQFHTPTFTMGKSFDTHGPIGPWIVTADEVSDPQALDLRTFVNGELRQSSNTGLMINRIEQQIEYLSTAFTLEPGDLIATGTPEGVGVGLDPQVFLQRGDVVRCEIDGIGAIENRVKG